jgi:hypothetical protein
MTTSALFDLLWGELAEVLGTAATSTLLRRAVKRASVHSSELAELSMYREGLDHKYAVPHGWHGDTDDTRKALRALIHELCPLLVEMTGTVVVRRLQRINEFQRRGLLAAQEEDQP